MNITLDQLLALEAIVRTGSLRAAAEMHWVPSAISYLVRGLESATGLELFDRSKRQAVLTPAGRRLLAQAQGVLEGRISLKRLRPSCARVGSRSCAPSSMAPCLLARFRRP